MEIGSKFDTRNWLFNYNNLYYNIYSKYFASLENLFRFLI